MHALLTLEHHFQAVWTQVQKSRCKSILAGVSFMLNSRFLASVARNSQSCAPFSLSYWSHAFLITSTIVHFPFLIALSTLSISPDSHHHMG